MSLIGRDMYQSASLLRMLARADDVPAGPASADAVDAAPRATAVDIDAWDGLAEGRPRADRRPTRVGGPGPEE